MSEIAVLPDTGEAAGFSYRVDYRPAYALATVALADGQSIKTEAGAMVSMSANLELESKMEGGLWSALKRSVGGRSAFVSTYTARGGVGELTLAPGAPGDIVALRLTDETVNIAASSYLAAIRRWRSTPTGAARRRSSPAAACSCCRSREAACSS